MAWKDGFVIEYVDNGSRSISCYKCINMNRGDRSCNRRGLYIPEIGRDIWHTCPSFELADDYNTVEMREKADRIRGRERNKAKSQKRNAAKRAEAQKKDQRVGSVPMVKGLHVGREVCNFRNKLGRVKTLTSTTAIVEFENGTIESYKIPDDFNDGVIHIQMHNRAQNSNPSNKQAQASQPVSEPSLDVKSLQNRVVYSSQYGKGIVAKTHGSMITVLFVKGRQEVKFDAATAIKKGSLRFGPVVKLPKTEQPAKQASTGATTEPAGKKAAQEPRRMTAPAKQRVKATPEKRNGPSKPKPATKRQQSKQSRPKVNVDRPMRGLDGKATISDALDNETLAKLEALKRQL